MFKQLFATMNEALDRIIESYSTADEEKKQELNHQLQVLRTMSDEYIEHWLLFEEKMSRFAEDHPMENLASTLMQDSSMLMDTLKDIDEPMLSEEFVRGQGYFKLLMFDEAIREFNKAADKHPDLLWARLYLALSHMQIGEYAEAYRYFHFIIPLTNHPKILATAYNALGCIQVTKHNLDKAYDLFRTAYKLDPSNMEPIMNMEVCMSNKGTLKYGSMMFH